MSVSRNRNAQSGAYREDVDRQLAITVLRLLLKHTVSSQRPFATNGDSRDALDSIRRVLPLATDRESRVSLPTVVRAGRKPVKLISRDADVRISIAINEPDGRERKQTLGS